MVSALLILMLLINVAIGFLVIYSQTKKTLLSVAGGFLIQITEYMMLGLFCACLEWYSSIGYMLISIALSLIIALHYRKDILNLIKNYRTEMKFKLMPIPYIFILVLTIPSMIFVNGFFGMGQDQGVYQVKAIALSSGEARNEITLNDERDFVLSTDFINNVSSYPDYSRLFYDDQVGFYENFDEYGTNETMTAVIHGTSSYPSLLAFDIDAFGLPGTLNVNYVLVFMSFIFLMELLEELKVNRFLGCIVLFFSILAPTVIWVSKSSLTESVQLPLLIAIVYGLVVMSRKGRIGLLIAAVATVGQSVLHLSAFSILPVIGVMLLVVYLRTNDFIILVTNLIITTIFELAFLVQCKLFDVYVRSNITVALNKMIGKEYSHMTYVSVITITGIVLALFTLIFTIPKVKAIALKLMDSIVYPIVVLLVFAASVALFARSYMAQIRINGSEAAIYNFSINGIALSCGILVFILSVAFFLMFVGKSMKDSRLELIVIAYVYFVFFLQATLHPVTNHYYYYSRYFTPVIFLVPLMFALMSDRFIKHKSISYVAGLLSVVLILPFSLFAASVRDDTHMTWKELDNYKNLFKKGDAVLFAGNSRKELLLTTKFLTGADCYIDYLPATELLNTYDNIYHVSINGDKYEDGESIYKSEIHVASDPQLPHKNIFPLFDFEGEESTIEVHKFNTDRLDNAINIHLADVQLINFLDVTDYYTWTSGTDSHILINIPESIDGKSVHISIFETGNRLMPDYISRSYLKIYVNGELCMSDKFCDYTNDIILGSEYFVPGEINDIRFEFYVWQPSTEYPDSIDDRILGFAIGGISIR